MCDNWKFTTVILLILSVITGCASNAPAPSSYGVTHSHNGEVHSHPLPSAGIHHLHSKSVVPSVNCIPYQNAVNGNGDLAPRGDRLIELSSCQKARNTCVAYGDCNGVTSNCKKILSCIGE